MLCALLDGEKRYTDLMEILERPDKTIYVNLKKLREQEFVKKLDRGVYGLTEEGAEKAEKVSLEKQREVRPQLEDWSDHENLKEKVRRKLHISGVGMDLQKPRSAKSIIASGGMLAFKDLVRAFSGLTEPEREYLDFSADLYISSPREYLGSEKLDWLELQAAWRAANPDAWKRRDRREGFDFDFPKAWENLEGERSEALKEGMSDLGLSKYKIFKGLRVFSLPLREKFKLVKDEPEKLAAPPESVEKHAE